MWYRGKIYLSSQFLLSLCMCGGQISLHVFFYLCLGPEQAVGTAKKGKSRYIGLEDPSNKKKNNKFCFCQSSKKLKHDSKNVSLKIWSWGLFEIRPFFSLFLMKKPLSKGQEWFLSPHFPLIGATFILKIGFRFSFWALEAPDLRVRKSQL